LNRTRLAVAAVIACFAHSPPATASEPPRPDLAISAATRAEVIRGVIREVESLYVFPDKARQIAATVRRQEKSKAFASMDSAGSLTRALTQILQDVGSDGHLRVDYSVTPRPMPRAPVSGAAEPVDSARLRESARQNYGFVKVERLLGNVGYIDLRIFDPPAAAGGTAAAAMALVARTDALILDLRQNGGGHGEMVNFLATYFFSGPTVHLRDVYDRESAESLQCWTLPYVPGERYTKPLYILTSKRTFSAAEAFAYGLKNQKRARIVGERTRGGAHPTSVRQINEHFAVFVPHARVMDAVTGTDWEGTGVAPDVEVPADEALLEAHRSVLQAFRAEETTANPGLDEVIRTLAAQLETVRRDRP
jgi:retinol-binding protein 3